MKRRLVAAFLAVVMVVLLGVTAGCGKEEEKEKEIGLVTVEGNEVILTKSEGTNPLVGDNGTGDYIYGGDPSVLVDGDTVYLYCGHDESTDREVAQAIYNMKNYLCYSTKDMVNWTYEGPVMEMDTVSWADQTSAWASQVVKHFDEEKQKEQYYLYFCSWDKEAAGKQSIGVAVSDSPTGPFTDIGHSLVKGTFTINEANSWEDIDPTVWIETDESGEEHRYLAWGNSRYFICELNEDMVSVKDYNGDGVITFGYDAGEADIINHQVGLTNYTEAPWIYRRQDADGNYYGDYYLFYANGWFENMAYATTDDLMEGNWNFGSVIMLPTATSNTNHMAVFDFQGKTYFVYHNGSLPAGNGYRRSVCITRLEFEEDGSVTYIPETAAGLGGTVVTIQNGDSGEEARISHVNFMNSSNENGRPYTGIEVGTGKGKVEEDSQWVLKKGRADEDKDTWVSIESENKPGLYLTALSDCQVVLSQDTDASMDTAKAQTFHTVVGLGDKKGVSFESVLCEGYYLTVEEDGSLCLTDGSDQEKATFYLDIAE